MKTIKKNYTKHILSFLILVFISVLTEGQETKKISGIVTFEKTPLSNVNVSIKDSNNGTHTNKNGEFSIKVKIGDIISFSYLGFKTKKILIEDTTETLNISLNPEVNILEESVIKASKRGKASQLKDKADEKFTTSRGNFDPRKAGYAVGFIDGESISNSAENIQVALQGKISNYSYDRTTGLSYLRGKNSSLNLIYPAAWEVDGVFMGNEAPNFLNLSQIKSIRVLKSVASTNSYGSQGVGGVIVIKTKHGSFHKKGQKKINEKFTNQNYYFDDASIINTDSLKSNKHVNILKNFNDANRAYNHYNSELRDKINFAQKIEIANSFLKDYQNKNITYQILDSIANKNFKNPEILKAIAYQYQILREKQKTIDYYKKIFYLRPKYAQSYRDLANAYVENEQFTKAWKLYMNYLLKDNNVNDEGIGQIIYNEMEWLFHNRKNQTIIKQKFIPKNTKIQDFSNDIRIVFEWNTSEAEFDLEFVSPDKRAYSFEHSLEKNEKLIFDEKTRGYSSKEFIIPSIDDGEWLINITYFGNKTSKPTYLKVTTYYNWSKPNQRTEIKNYNFNEQNNKIQLYKFTKASLKNPQ